MTVDMLRRAPAGCGGGKLGAPRATAGRGAAAAFFAGSAVFAGAVAVVAGYAPERDWGVAAAAAYALSAVLALLPGRCGRPAALGVSLAGAVAAPLVWLAAAGAGQPEVDVIIRSAGLLLRHGSPYLSPAAIAASGHFTSYDPYLPALAVFGLPRALGLPGLAGDPRLWFGLTFAGLLMLALAHLGRRSAARWAAVIMASPVVAYPLAVGGDDLAVLALVCLGLALLRTRPRPLVAGLVLGLAAAMKATAWPDLAVAAALLAARDGRRALAWFATAALATTGAIIAPVALAAPAAMVANTLAYPLGMTSIRSPAASVLPGHLIAQAGPDGRWVAMALLVAAGLGMAGWLLVRPPRGAAAAGWRLAAGLALMFTFAPASRYGYFIYPLILSAWAWLTSAAGGDRHLAELRPVILRDREVDDLRRFGEVWRQRLLRLPEVPGLHVGSPRVTVEEGFDEDVLHRVLDTAGPVEP